MFSNSYIWGLDFLRIGVINSDARGLDFLRLEAGNSYVWGLDFLRLGLVILTFGG